MPQSPCSAQDVSTESLSSWDTPPSQANRAAGHPTQRRQCRKFRHECQHFQNVFSKMLSTLPRALTAVWLQMVPLRNELERPQGYPRINDYVNGFPQCPLLRTSNTLWSSTLSERRIDCPEILKIFEADFL